VVAATLLTLESVVRFKVGVNTENRYLLLVELPRAQPAQVARQVGELFGLTAAEARVLGEFLDGSPPSDIAAKHGTSMATVRSQISSILAKTGTKGQAELLLLLRNLRF
jgi:DNA-binding CsgD family transcriptional regulator